MHQHPGAQQYTRRHCVIEQHNKNILNGSELGQTASDTGKEGQEEQKASHILIFKLARTAVAVGRFLGSACLRSHSMLRSTWI